MIKSTTNPVYISPVVEGDLLISDIPKQHAFALHLDYARKLYLNKMAVPSVLTIQRNCEQLQRLKTMLASIDYLNEL